MKLPFSPRNDADQAPSQAPEQHDRSPVVHRRDFLKTSVAALFAGSIPWNETWATEGMDDKTLMHLKHDELTKNRGKIQTLRGLREASPEEVLGKESGEKLFAQLRKYLACIDEGIVDEKRHKIGIAGLGAEMTPDQRKMFALYLREHPELTAMIEEAFCHERCAARNDDDGAAEEGAKVLLTDLGQPLSKLHRAGFSKNVDLKMNREPHLHPGQSFLVDATKFRCNGQALGVPTFEIAATGVPIEYVQKEVALGGKIIAGRSGMGAALGPKDPILLFLAAENPEAAKQLEQDLKPALKTYPKEPEIIHLIQKTA